MYHSHKISTKYKIHNQISKKVFKNIILVIDIISILFKQLNFAMK